MLHRRSSCPHIVDNPYYHPSINNPTQVVRLIEEEGNVNGLFLLRKSFSQPNNFTISVKHEKGLFHIKITQTNDGRFQLSDGLSFPSIYHLINHFSTNAITNVEELENVYLLRGIMPKRTSWFPRSFSTSSHLQSGGMSGGSRIISGNSGSGSNGGDYLEILEETIHRNSTSTARRIRNQYILPLPKEPSQDTYVRSTDAENPDDFEELLNLPAGWQALIKNGAVIYKEAVSGARVHELPYNIFTRLSSPQFEKLKRFFNANTLNSHSQISTTTPTTPTTTSSSTSTTPTTPTSSSSTSTASTPTTATIPTTATTPTTAQSSADNYANNNACIRLLRNDSTLSLTTSPYLNVRPFTSPNGSVTSPNGSVTSHNDSVTSANGSVTSLNGSVTSPNGSVTSLNGSVTSPNGSVTSPNGSVTSPNGSVTSPNDSKFIMTKGGSVYARMDGACANLDKK